CPAAVNVDAVGFVRRLHGLGGVAVRIFFLVCQVRGNPRDVEFLVCDGQREHEASTQEHGLADATRRDAGRKQRDEFVVALHPGDGEHAGQQHDGFTEPIENQGDVMAVVEPNMPYHWQDAVVPPGEFVQVGEQVHDDVQAEQANEANEVRLEVRTD